MEQHYMLVLKSTLTVSQINLRAPATLFESVVVTTHIQSVRSRARTLGRFSCDLLHSKLPGNAVYPYVHRLLRGEELEPPVTQQSMQWLLSPLPTVQTCKPGQPLFLHRECTGQTLVLYLRGPTG